MFVLPVYFDFFLQNAGELKKSDYCIDLSLGGPFFSNHPVANLIGKDLSFPGVS